MSLLYDINIKARAAASAASDKARELADTAKLSAAILAEKRDLDKKYRDIGKWYVCNHSGDVPDAVSDLVKSAKESRKRIIQLEDQREHDADEPVPTGQVCPICGFVTHERFCPKCGGPMPTK